MMNHDEANWTDDERRRGGETGRSQYSSRHKNFFLTISFIACGHDGIFLLLMAETATRTTELDQLKESHRQCQQIVDRKEWERNEKTKWQSLATTHKAKNRGEREGRRLITRKSRRRRENFELKTCSAQLKSTLIIFRIIGCCLFTYVKPFPRLSMSSYLILCANRKLVKPKLICDLISLIGEFCVYYTRVVWYSLWASVIKLEISPDQLDCASIMIEHLN